MSSSQMKMMPSSSVEETDLLDAQVARARSMLPGARPVGPSNAAQHAPSSAQGAQIHLIHTTQAIPAQSAPAYIPRPDADVARTAAQRPQTQRALQAAKVRPMRANETRPTSNSPKHQEENVLTGALLVGFVVLGLLVVVSIMGLFLLNGESNNASLSRAELEAQSSNGLSSALTSPEQNASRRTVQKIIALEEQNRRMQLELMMLRKKNADMTSALAKMNSLYSGLRIDNSWILAKKDLVGAEPMQAVQRVFDPILYSDFPLLSESEAQLNDQLVSLDQNIDTALSFKARDALSVANPSEENQNKPVDLPSGVAPTGTSIQAAVTNLSPISTPADANTADNGRLSDLGANPAAGNILRLPQSKPAIPSNVVSDQAPLKLAAIDPQSGFETEQTLRQPSGPLNGNTARFLAKMKALKAGTLNEPITILHIGDSHIASDSLTRGIRRRLQSLYGDAGRGAVVPAKAYKYAHADGVSLTASRGWSAANSLRVKSGPYGLSGVRVSATSAGAKMTMKSKTGSFDWAEVTLYVGPKQGNVTIATQGSSKKVSARAAQTGSKTVRIEGSSNILTVTHGGGGKTTVLNWATGKNKPGIQYVNFGLSGATAAVTKRWSDTLLSNDIKQLDPDLIIYGYGTNEGYNDNLNMASYRKMASDFVGKMRKAAPDAAMMFIGPADGARRRSSSISCGGGWYTPKKLGAVRSTLQSMAKENAGLFWDWASAMGGRCGAAKWSTQSPRLVGKDRVHLTAKGYDKSAGAFVAFLENQIKNSLKIATN